MRGVALHEQPSRTTRPSANRVFPLYLTPFETYMFLDDRPEWPMTFTVQLEFSGEIDRDAFEYGLENALQRHPLCRAFIRPAKQGKDCWVDAKGTRPFLHWGGIDDPIEFPDGREFIDLRTEVGLRIWIRGDEQKTVVTTQCHHCVCDGIGLYQFLGDLLWFYTQRTGEVTEELPPLDHLRSRLRANIETKTIFEEPVQFQTDWGEAARMLFGRVTPLEPARKSTPAAATTPFPGIRSHVFEKEEFRKIRITAQAAAQTPNDFLMEKLFSHIGAVE